MAGIEGGRRSSCCGVIQACNRVFILNKPLLCSVAPKGLIVTMLRSNEALLVESVHDRYANYQITFHTIGGPDSRTLRVLD